MDVSIREESATDLVAYCEVPITFTVDRVLVPSPDLGPTGFREEAVDTPFTRDYDTIPGNHPSAWVDRFDTSTWSVLSAWQTSFRIAGVVLAWGSPGVDMLEGRDDLAVLWDVRVRPEFRGYGVGARLLHAAGQWAALRGCRQLKVETQNTNVPACRFYERVGFRLERIDPTAYPDLPGEIQLLWYRTIPSPKP